MWYSNLPSILSPEQKPDPVTIRSAALLPFRLIERRATHKPLPDAISLLKRQALIRSSSKKAQRELKAYFNTRREQYDAEGQLLPKFAERVIKLRSPMPAKATKKEKKSKLDMDKKKDRKGRKLGKKNRETICCASLSVMSLEPTTSLLLDIEIAAARAARKFEWITFKNSYEQSDKKTVEMKAKLRDLCPGKIRAGFIKEKKRLQNSLCL